MMYDFSRILVLAPHTDDGELGCGGSVARFVSEGKTVYYVAFSMAENSVPEGWPKDILKKEVRKATRVLGIPATQLTTLDYPVREFPRLRQEILEDMVRFRKDIQPDLVFVPSANDTHQDHETIAREAFRAFKHTTMLGYEIPWNIRTFEASAFIVLEEEHVQTKIEALRCYQSQRDRYYFGKEFILGWARTRATQIAHQYAEVFEAVRWIVH